LRSARLCLTKLFTATKYRRGDHNAHRSKYIRPTTAELSPQVVGLVVFLHLLKGLHIMNHSLPLQPQPLAY